MSVSHPATLLPTGAAKSRRSLPISTLKAGDLVTVNLSGRAVDRIHQWAGEVVAVDRVAIRRKTFWYRLALSACSSTGERIIP